MGTYWQVIDGAAGFGTAQQAAHDEAVVSLASYEWLHCSAPSIKLDRDYIQRDGFGGQAGARMAPVAGKRSGTVEVSFLVPGQLSSWSPSSGPSAGIEHTLIEELIGSASVGAYTAAGIEDPLTATDANTWELAAGTLAPGEIWAAGSDADAKSIGVVKSVSGTTVTLSEDAAAVPVAGANLYPLRTMYPTTSTPTSRSMRFIGSAADQDLILIGCIPVSLKLDFAVGQPPRATITYRFTDWTYPGAGSVATVDPADVLTVPPMLGSSNGRVTINGASSGTADPDGTCGLGGLTIEVTAAARSVDGYGAAQGECAVVLGRREVKATLTAPHAAYMVSGGAFALEGIDVSLLAHVGDRPGKYLVAHLPAARIASQVAIEIADEVVGYKLELVAAPYTGDGSATAPGNTPFRLGVG